MALASLHLAAIPVLAGLVAGTGAVTASFMTGPAPTAATATAVSPQAASAVPAQAGRPCATQTWPYIDQKCISGSADLKRNVRLVAAPRTGDQVSDETPSTAAASVAAATTAEPGLITGDTVLRQPQRVATRDIAPDPQLTPKPRTKSADTRRQRTNRRFATQSYQVPAEYSGARDTRPVIVVRPLRLDFFR